MEGTLRTFNEDLRARLLERIEAVCTYTAQAFQGRARVANLCSTCGPQPRLWPAGGRRRG